MKCHLLLPIVLSLTLTACALGAQKGSVVYFPQRVLPPDDPRTQMEALAAGELTLVGGCLRLTAPAGGESNLLIWPSDYGYRESRGTVEVLDERGQVVARVGDHIEVGGGETKSLAHAAAEGVVRKVCPGPYWVVGEGVRRLGYP